MILRLIPCIAFNSKTINTQFVCLPVKSRFILDGKNLCCILQFLFNDGDKSFS